MGLTNKRWRDSFVLGSKKKPSGIGAKDIRLSCMQIADMRGGRTRYISSAGLIFSSWKGDVGPFLPKQGKTVGNEGAQAIERNQRTSQVGSVFRKRKKLLYGYLNNQIHERSFVASHGQSFYRNKKRKK